MSLRISKMLVHGFALVIRLLGVCLDAVRRILDIIDNGIQDGSANLPSWYFELVDILNVMQESFDKLDGISRSDELKKSEE